MRYIDADKLVEMYERSAEDDWNKKTAPSSWAEAFECAIADIDDQPTADVAREFAEKLKEKLNFLAPVQRDLVFVEIDNLVKGVI